jgi:hypothetical protein
VVRSSMGSHNLRKRIRLASMTCPNTGIFGQPSKRSMCRFTFTPALPCQRTSPLIKGIRG